MLKIICSILKINLTNKVKRIIIRNILYLGRVIKQKKG